VTAPEKRKASEQRLTLIKFASQSFNGALMQGDVTLKCNTLLVVATAAMLIGSGLFAPSARAGYVVTLDEVPGTGIVATGSGPIDLTVLTYLLPP